MIRLPKSADTLAAGKKPPESEAEFQRCVIDLAHARGWSVAHFRPARTKAGGWITPVAADGKGWPDLALCRERLVFAELKRQNGKLAPEQAAWIISLQYAGQEVHVWRPSDWAEVERVLQ